MKQLYNNLYHHDILPFLTLFIEKGASLRILIIRDLNFNISLETHSFCFISSSNPQEKPTYKACH